VTTDDLSGDLAWAGQALSDHAGEPVAIERVTQLPARTGRLHRLDVSGGRRAGRYFLKRYTPAAVGSWDEHAGHLRLIAGAVSGDPRLLPYVLAGADAGRHLVLAAEVPGVALTRRADQTQVWHGIGRWLARLHAASTLPPSATRAPELVAYMELRFRQWMERDPDRASLAGRAMAAASFLPAMFRGPVAVALCHGDVTAANVRVDGGAAGLIDFDDVRVDMPGLDVSQAELEIEELSRGWLTLRPGAAAQRARAALRAGYGAGYAEGPAFWLPHLRNLAVFLTTIAGHRQAGFRQRALTARRYDRTIAELERTIAAVGSARHGGNWRRAAASD
jgi:aminoglycoside phosphotransferase